MFVLLYNQESIPVPVPGGIFVNYMLNFKLFHVLYHTLSFPLPRFILFFTNYIYPLILPVRERPGERPDPAHEQQLQPARQYWQPRRAHHRGLCQNH